MSQRPKTVRQPTSELEAPPTTLSKKQFQQVKNLTKDDGHFNLVRNFNLADVITLCNGACGALSIFSNMRYLISHDPYYLWLAMWCIPLGFTFDVFDGRVARWRQTSSILGQELDSLADARLRTHVADKDPPMLFEAGLEQSWKNKEIPGHINNMTWAILEFTTCQDEDEWPRAEGA